MRVFIDVVDGGSVVRVGEADFEPQMKVLSNITYYQGLSNVGDAPSAILCENPGGHEVARGIWHRIPNELH